MVRITWLELLAILIGGTGAGAGIIGSVYYCCCKQSSVQDTGSTPSTKIKPYLQSGPLKGIPKDDSYRGNDSEDEERQTVTDSIDAIPKSFEETLYNCWSWAISPISNVLAISNPPGISDKRPFTIDKMKKATNDYLKNMMQKGRITHYNETTVQGEVRNFMRQKDIPTESKLIVGLRVIGGVSTVIPDGHDYHYVRWYHGQWTAKGGISGVVLMDMGPHPTENIEPERMWAGSALRTGKRGSVYTRWDTDKQVHKESIYETPTVYYLVTLPIKKQKQD